MAILTHVSPAVTPQAAARCGTTSPAGQPPLGARWSSWPVPSSTVYCTLFKVRALDSSEGAGWHKWRGLEWSLTSPGNEKERERVKGAGAIREPSWKRMLWH